MNHGGGAEHDSNLGQANEVWPVAVVGAGAAGLLAALFAARAGARVLLLETRPRPGAKIRVSGGGRCNVLPSAMQLEDFHTSGSMHTLRNILFSWPLAAVRAFFEDDLGVPLKREDTGKLFPVSERPQDVVDALLAACGRAGVVLRGGWRVARVSRVADAGGARFDVESAAGERIRCARLVLATGGLSLPKTGSDGAGLAFASALGVGTVPTYPALVPLRTADRRWKALAGIAVPARLTARRGARILEVRERPLLVTHRGWSGPVVLDMSRHVTAPDCEDVALHVRWGGDATPDWDATLRATPRGLVATCLRVHLPVRLADLLLELAEIPPAQRVHELDRVSRLRLVTVLDDYALPRSGDEGYATAEVTGGGVALDAVAPRTLECRAVPGLHVAGEMLDVVGRIGGYNFLWAFVTGRKAGAAAREGW